MIISGSSGTTEGVWVGVGVADPVGVGVIEPVGVGVGVMLGVGVKNGGGVPVGAGSSLGGEVGRGSPGSSDARTFIAGWLKANEIRRKMEIMTGNRCDIFFRVGTFILLLLKKIPPCEFQYQDRPLNGNQLC